jgi:uncharacterized membrane protein YsdA (DUF1294 family)
MASTRRPFLLYTLLVLVPALAGSGYLHYGLGWNGLVAWSSVVNVLVLPLWAFDKRRSKKDGPRVPERTLHLFAFLGAAPGSLLARAWLRHKTRKPAFLWWPVTCLLLHAAALGYWLA